jgi:AraC-like DNA-binding protein
MFFILESNYTSHATMINAIKILPSPLLQASVSCFTFREFDTLDNELNLPIHGMHEFYLNLYLSEKADIRESFHDSTAKEVDDKKIIEGRAMGLLTTPKGVVKMRGYNKVFSIQFKGNGFYKIFGIPQLHLTNEVLDPFELFTYDFKYLHEQLANAIDIGEMMASVEAFLLNHLKHSKAKDWFNRIEKTANFILENKGSVDLKNLAYQASLSTRAFERNFEQHIGVTPKVYARLVRFNRALLVKMKNPKESWSFISNRCNYFDHAHLIKDFKEFTGTTPNVFLRDTPPTAVL